jgi:hypothetical protein
MTVLIIYLKGTLAYVDACASGIAIVTGPVCGSSSLLGFCDRIRIVAERKEKLQMVGHELREGKCHSSTPFVSGMI